MIPAAKVNINISVRNSESNIEEIPKLKYDDTREVMGVIQSPSDTMVGQIEKCKKTIST